MWHFMLEIKSEYRDSHVNTKEVINLFLFIMLFFSGDETKEPFHSNFAILTVRAYSVCVHTRIQYYDFIMSVPVPV